MGTLFANCVIFMKPTGFLPKRLEFLKEAIRKEGATVVESMKDQTLTHVVFDVDYHYKKKMYLEDVLGMLDIHNYEDVYFTVVTCKWVSACLKARALVDVEKFQFPIKYEAEVALLMREDDQYRILSKKMSMNL